MTGRNQSHRSEAGPDAGPGTRDGCAALTLVLRAHARRKGRRCHRMMKRKSRVSKSAIRLININTERPLGRTLLERQIFAIGSRRKRRGPGFVGLRESA